MGLKPRSSRCWAVVPKNRQHTVIFDAKDNENNLVKSAPVTITVSGGMDLKTTATSTTTTTEALTTTTTTVQFTTSTISHNVRRNSARVEREVLV